MLLHFKSTIDRQKKIYIFFVSLISWFVQTLREQRPERTNEQTNKQTKEQPFLSFCNFNNFMSKVCAIDYYSGLFFFLFSFFFLNIIRMLFIFVVLHVTVSIWFIDTKIAFYAIQSTLKFIYDKSIAFHWEYWMSIICGWCDDFNLYEIILHFGCIFFLLSNNILCVYHLNLDV